MGSSIYREVMPGNEYQWHLSNRTGAFLFYEGSMMMGYKTLNGLMKHLRESGIDIKGSSQKQLLVNIGYFHGYKGYRFFKTSSLKLPFKNFNEVYATNMYDNKLKKLFYDKVMFIETATKNIALQCIMEEIKSENIQDMYEKVVASYKNSLDKYSVEQRRKAQQNKLKLQGNVQGYIINGYRNQNPQITHYYESANYSSIPLWALFEVIMMGDFGFLLSCLTFNMRDTISKRMNLNVSSDTNRELIYKYIYVLKDLRNAIAHNAVVFDTRFNRISPSKAMKKTLELEIGLPYINFKTIGDYVILITYYLILLKIRKKDINKFIHDFESIILWYKEEVDSSVSNLVIHPDIELHLEILKKYVKNID